MKTNSLVSAWVAMTIILTAAPAAEPARAVNARVGIYDSRVLSFAHFWSEPGRKEREVLVAAAKAAKDSGDAVRFKELSAQLSSAQARSHLQVFSSAPADEALAALKDKLPAIQQELGVTRFVSKWDEAALKDIPEANRIDATDRLAREFSPDERRRKTIEQMKTSKPIPLEQAKQMIAAGRM